MIDDGRWSGETPDLVDGRSARSWIRLAGIGLVGGALCAPLIAGAARLLPAQTREPAVAVIMIVGIALATVAVVAGRRTLGAIEREREAGYTTLYGRYFELWQLDPRTGDVLRRPGEREVRRRPRDGPLD